MQSSGAGRSLWPRKGLGLAQGHAARTIFRLPQLLAFQGCMGGTPRGPSMGYASPWEALVLPVRQVFQDEAPSYYVRCVDRLGHLLRFSRSHTSSATAQRQGSASPAQPTHSPGSPNLPEPGLLLQSTISPRSLAGGSSGLSGALWVPDLRLCNDCFPLGWVAGSMAYKVYCAVTARPVPRLLPQPLPACLQPVAPCSPLPTSLVHSQSLCCVLGDLMPSPPWGHGSVAPTCSLLHPQPPLPPPDSSPSAFA